MELVGASLIASFVQSRLDSQEGGLAHREIPDCRRTVQEGLSRLLWYASAYLHEMYQFISGREGP